MILPHIILPSGVSSGCNAVAVGSSRCARPCHCSFRTFPNSKHPNKVTASMRKRKPQLEQCEASIELQDGRRCWFRIRSISIHNRSGQFAPNCDDDALATTIGLMCIASPAAQTAIFMAGSEPVVLAQVRIPPARKPVTSSTDLRNQRMIMQTVCQDFPQRTPVSVGLAPAGRQLRSYGTQCDPTVLAIAVVSEVRYRA